jgi:hypothetical protein
VFFGGRLAGFVLSAACLAAAARGQEPEYRSDPVDPKAQSAGGVAMSAARDPATYAAQKARVDEYFDKFYFPSMTGTAPEQLARLGDLRYNLFKRYLWATTNEQLQRELTDKTYKAMLRIVGAQNPPYHPAVRYNAVLTLGMLDRRYAPDSGGARPPEPLPQATQVLTKVVEMGMTDSRFTPPVILGALVGLERHAQYRQSVAADDVNKLTASLLKFVGQKDPIQEMDRGAYAWLQVRAATALAQLGTVGENNNIHAAMLQLVDNLSNLDDRCAVTGLLNEKMYEGVKLADAASIEPLFKLARDLGEAEAKRAEEFQKAEIGGGAAIGLAPRGDYLMQVPGAEEEERYPKRHVLARLTDLRTGLKAVHPAVDEATQKKIDAVVAAVEPVIAAAVDKSTVELAFTQAVMTMNQAIQVAAAPADAPAADEADPEF